MIQVISHFLRWALRIDLLHLSDFFLADFSFFHDFDLDLLLLQVDSVSGVLVHILADLGTQLCHAHHDAIDSFPHHSFALFAIFANKFAAENTAHANCIYVDVCLCFKFLVIYDVVELEWLPTIHQVRVQFVLFFGATIIVEFVKLAKLIKEILRRLRSLFLLFLLLNVLLFLLSLLFNLVVLFCIFSSSCFA